MSLRTASIITVLVVVMGGCASGSDDATSGSATPAATVAGDPTGSAPVPSPDGSTVQPGVAPSPDPSPLADPFFEEFPVPAGSRPHDAAPAPDGSVWYVAQGAGELGRLDPATGDVETVGLGQGSAPHGVIVGPQGDPWITDGGRNSIITVDPDDLTLTEYPLPGGNANLNTAAFDAAGRLWFTGQAGIYGTVDPATGDVSVHDAPRGRGPYGMDATPDGTVWFASLAGSYIARIDDAAGTLTTVDVPTEGGGARRIWSDSGGNLWVTEWFAGRLARYDPATGTWTEWDMPADGSRPYAVFVDDRDHVWVTDFASNALVRFDPVTEQFESFTFPSPGSQVRQLLGRPGEVWGVGSATDTAIVLYTAR